MCDPFCGDAGQSVKEDDREQVEEEEAVAAGADWEPQKKKDFDTLRREYKTTLLAHKFYQDRGLQARLRVVVKGSEYTHYEYAGNLRHMSEGQESQAAWGVERATVRYLVG